MPTPQFPPQGQACVTIGNAWGLVALGAVIPVSAYANLNAALTAIGSTPTTLIIDVPTTITGNTIIPSTMSLFFPQGGSINDNGFGYTLAINGFMSAGLYRIFLQTILPSGMHVINPEWFGAVADNATDSTAAINASHTALGANGGIVQFSAGTYRAQRSLIIPSNITWQGLSYAYTTIKALDSQTSPAHFIVIYNNASNIKLFDMTLDGNGAVVPGGYGTAGSTLEMDNSHNIRVARCSFYQNKFATIGAVGIYDTIIEENIINNAVDTGIAIVGISGNTVPHDVIVKNNYIYGGLFGISFDGGTSLPDVRPYNNKILENVIYPDTVTHQNPGDGTKIGIDAQNAVGLDVSHNTVHLNKSNLYGIRSYNTGNSHTVHDNQLVIDNASLTNVYGVDIDGTAAGTKQEPNMVANNQIYLATGVTGPSSGIVGIHAAGHDANLYNNVVRGCVQGILLDSANTSRTYRLIGNILTENQYGYYETGAYANPSTVILSGNLSFNNTVLNAATTPASYYEFADNNVGIPSTGAAVASATTIIPTGSRFHVTGTTAIVNINLPWGSYSQDITIVPDGIFTWTAAGNIALAGTAVVGKALKMTFDVSANKWYPSYTS